MKPEQIIGFNIKSKRREKGMKSETLGKQLNITKGRISQIENGDCKELTISRIIKIAEILDVGFFEIISDQSQVVNIQKSDAFFAAQDSITPELISALIYELAKRINK